MFKCIINSEMNKKKKIKFVQIYFCSQLEIHLFFEYYRIGWFTCFPQKARS